MCSGKALRTQFWEDEAGRQWEARFRDGVGAGGTRNRVLPNPVGGFCFPVYDEEQSEDSGRVVAQRSKEVAFSLIRCQ